MPRGDRIALSAMPWLALSRESWREWYGRELRGSQEYSLLQKFYEEEASAYRLRWHRRQLWCTFARWTDQTPVEANTTRERGRYDRRMGEAWARHGRMGRSSLMKQRRSSGGTGVARDAAGVETETGVGGGPVSDGKAGAQAGGGDAQG